MGFHILRGFCYTWSHITFLRSISFGRAWGCEPCLTYLIHALHTCSCRIHPQKNARLTPPPCALSLIVNSGPGGVILRAGGRCRSQQASAGCQAGVELCLTLQEDWEGRKRVVGTGREVRCRCGQRVMGAPTLFVADGPAEVTWRIEATEAVDAGHKHCQTGEDTRPFAVPSPVSPQW